MNINLFYSICILILISIFCIFFLKLYKKTNSLKIYLILLTLISLNLYYSSHSPITPYPDTLPIKETIHMTDKEIVYTIVKQELSYHKNKSLFANGKIFDYKDISVYSVPNEPTIYSVVFSIQSGDDDFWLPGNGTKQENNWIINKSNYMQLIKEKDYYRLISIRTGL